MPELKRPDLLRQQAMIDGRWCDADDGSVLTVHDPATGALAGTVPNLTAAETRQAIAAAARALTAWRALTAGERAAILRRWHDLVLAHKEDLARILTAEQGKPLSEARAEIAYAASFFDWFAEEARRIFGEVIPSPWPERRILTLRQPIGVVAVITPWNFPSAMLARKAAAALAAGCTVVAKPASATPFSALALAALGLEAGIPPGVLNVVTGAAEAIGAELTANPTVRMLSFTGSTETGKRLMAACAGTVKKVALELGGNAPFIVFDDADLDAAIEGALAAKFRNCGQTCVCANRILVQADIYKAFAERFAERVSQLRVGPGQEEGVQLGPLINPAALAKVEAHVADALAHGARLLTGGARHALGGNFYRPTVLTGVTPEMRVCQEETFGPVAPLLRFTREDEAISIANATEYGLAAFFYTRDLGRAWRVAEALEYGMVGVNAGVISTAVAPFGGVKQSGLGREGGREGIAEFLETKYVCLGL